jgi:hypothetical protein
MDVLEDELHKKDVIVNIWVDDDEKSNFFFKFRRVQT